MPLYWAYLGRPRYKGSRIQDRVLLASAQLRAPVTSLKWTLLCYFELHFCFSRVWMEEEEEEVCVCEMCVCVCVIQDSIG